MEHLIYDYSPIGRAIRFMEDHHQQLELLPGHEQDGELSFQQCGQLLSSWAGATADQFMYYLSTPYLKKQLHASAKTIEKPATGFSMASSKPGPNTKLQVMTWEQHAQSALNRHIVYCFCPSPFGECLVAKAGRFVCWLSFVDNRSEAIDQLKAHWGTACEYTHEEADMGLAERIFSPTLDQPDIPMLAVGTDFQSAVWQALQLIPPGSLVAYQHIAFLIGNPKAVQAVGAAIADNCLAWVVPCHRVIRKDGLAGDYKWGPLRKKGILGWEVARLKASQSSGASRHT